MTPPQPTLTTIALLVGDVAALAASATQLLIGLRYFSARDFATECGAGPIIVVVDGPEWRVWLDKQGDLATTIARATFLHLPAATHLPGVMVNRALDLVATESFGIVTIGCEVSTWFANRQGLVDGLRTNRTLIAAGYRGAGETRSILNESFLVHQDDPFSSAYPHAWLQMLDLVPMSNCVISLALSRMLGGFSEAPALQRMWWWEFTLRAARQHEILSLPLQPVTATSWHHFVFTRTLGEPVDTNLRTMMRLGGERGRCLPLRQDEQQKTVPADDTVNQIQSAAWRLLPDALRARLLKLVWQKKRPLNIVVLGGVNEPAHNQLCFFNYFALMRDWNVLTWRSVLDERATFDDIAGCDLVIFSRVRSDNGVALIEACAARQIRTLYMLDDNWFWLGREWDDYADIFAPGKPPYENFMRCVKCADMTLTYSAPLAEDLRPFARRLVTLPTNVDLDMFPQRAAPTATDKTVIGYVGSLRKNMIAFDALVGLATRRADVTVFVMSNALPAEFSTLPVGRVKFAPYQFNYEAYAARVTRARPDILVAPVGHTRFEASKCPNKFLEITACGAVGVYSRTEPYLSHVVEHQTGVFADDNVAAWTTAIEKLIDAPETRQRIARQARAHVTAHYATPAVLSQFVEMLLTALSTGE